MSILEAINYEKYNNITTPSWFKAERYEYCESFYENGKEKKNGMLSHLASMLLSAL